MNSKQKPKVPTAVREDVVAVVEKLKRFFAAEQMDPEIAALAMLGLAARIAVDAGAQEPVYLQACRAAFATAKTVH